MKANKCDRCGTLYERECTPDVRINIYNHPYGDEWVDLCPKCQEKLEQFVANCWQEKARWEQDIGTTIPYCKLDKAFCNGQCAFKTDDCKGGKTKCPMFD